MENEASVSLEDLINSCRCCTKYFDAGQKSVKISKSIQSRFEQLTGMELIESEYYSRVICENCNSKLSEYSDFRSELVEYQQCLYNMCIQESVINEVEDEEEEEEEYLIETAADLKTEIIEDEDYIIEEVESLEQLPSEHEIIVTSSSSFYQEQELAQEKKKKNEKTKFCEHCRQTFAASGFYHHMMRFHRNNECRFECDFCLKSFNLKNDLIMHIKKHLNRDDRKKFPCPSCDSILLSSSALSNHEKHFHSSVIEVHPCEYCNKSFRSRMKYLQHRKLVHESSGEYPCSICQRIFSTKSYLEKHLENVHGELKPCPICGKMYKPASLKRHQQSHTARQFNCPYENCDKIYQMKVSLKHHMQAHHDNKDHCCNCEQCGASFPTKRHLLRHIQRQHTAKKLQCDVVGCSSLFSRKDYLVEHYKKHKNIDEDARNELLSRVKESKEISW